MRGKVSSRIDEVYNVRITPAYAGKSILVYIIAYCTIGSPPPMRGKVAVMTAVLVVSGITPAYAGKRRD